MRAEIAAAVAARTAAGKRPPGLAAVLVGDDPASHAYVRNKQKACARGRHRAVGSTTCRPTPPRPQLLDLVGRLNADPAVHGILVQLPLPKQIDEEAVIHAVGPARTWTASTRENVGLLAAGLPRYYPCTPHGVIELLRRNGVELAGKEVVVVGRSNIVGKPLALMLMQKPTAANPAGVRRDRDRRPHQARRTWPPSAAGRTCWSRPPADRGLITPDMVKPGAAVVDVGTNPTEGGKLVGDVAAAVADVAGRLSPVPGGVGPMTITMLLHNTLRAAELIDE